ncbi:MAG: hypothetical protein UIM24_01290 [Clostridia bacterium]|nr:hypothetical protein [Clostridia bacterium]
MTAVVVAVLSVFAVYGVMALIREICVQILANAGEYDRIIIYVKSDAERMEGVVRSLMVKNPTAEIVIVPKEKGGEVREIIDKLSCDYGRIHIGRMDIDTGN